MPASPAPAVRRVEAVVNEASGSVGAGAAEKLAAILAEFGLESNVAEVAPKDLGDALAEAVERKPDLLVVLAGDGTARTAAELCGPEGPLVAPLPGGTMNILPKAIYGDLNWQEALRAALQEGIERPVSGGQIDGKHFFVAAILGSPALWAPAREALRERKFRLAIMRALRAWKRAFEGRLRFRLSDTDRHWERAEALALLCPLISKAMDEETALEAAILDPKGATEAFRLAVKALWGDWRADPTVKTRPVRHGKARARGRIPAILDGELVRLDGMVDISFRRVAFRALGPPGPHPQTDIP